MGQSIFTPSKQHAMRWPRLFETIGILGLLGLLDYAYNRLIRSRTNHKGPGQILRVRGLIVVDEHGIERVWIGAPLPDPSFLGKRGQRQAPISGILLMDADGTERSGYVTDEFGQ